MERCIIRPSNRFYTNRDLLSYKYRSSFVCRISNKKFFKKREKERIVLRKRITLELYLLLLTFKNEISPNSSLPSLKI